MKETKSPEEVREILDNTVWSYTRVKAYDTCPKMFYDTYILKKPKKDNAFSEYGSFVHMLLEKYYSGSLDAEQMQTEYRNLFSMFVQSDFPKMKTDLRQTYYRDGDSYFDPFIDPFVGYKVLGVELKMQMEVCGRPFIGYIDLLMKKGGDLFIADHKSRKRFKSRAELDEYARQLYLYANYVFDRFGKFPKSMFFNTFRACDVIEVPFQKENYEEAMSWFSSTTDRIYTDSKWYDKIFLEYKKAGKKLSEYKKNDFFCTELCSVGNGCRRSR